MEVTERLGGDAAPPTAPSIEGARAQSVRCHHCRHRNEPAANFCSWCGHSLVHDGDEETMSLGDLGALVEILASDHDLEDVLAELPEDEGMLIVRRGPNARSRYWLGNDFTTLGRHPTSDIFLDDITVSRQHAVIRKTAMGYEISDVGSLNGTYLDHQRIDSALLLHLGELQIGRFVLTFVRGGRSSDGNQGRWAALYAAARSDKRVL